MIVYQARAFLLHTAVSVPSHYLAIESALLTFPGEAIFQQLDYLVMVITSPIHSPVHSPVQSPDFVASPTLRHRGSLRLKLLKSVQFIIS